MAQSFRSSSFKVFKHLVSSISLPIISSLSTFSCHARKWNQSHKLPFYESTLTSSYPLKLIYYNVWSSPIESFDGNKYYVIFIDHFTCYIWFYPLKQNSDVHDFFIYLEPSVENFFK